MAAINAFYAQSGGATAVINATACGLIEEARRQHLADPTRKPVVRHRFYHVPASNTAVGHLILENP